MRSLVMSLFSRDLLINQLRYLQYLNLINNLHSAWFLDGRTPILVISYASLFITHTHAHTQTHTHTLTQRDTRTLLLNASPPIRHTNF